MQNASNHYCNHKQLLKCNLVIHQFFTQSQGLMNSKPQTDDETKPTPKCISWTGYLRIKTLLLT